MQPITEQKKVIPNEFNRISTSYDLLTGMNPGYQRHLAMSAARLGLGPDAKALDLCCGTGLSTEALASVYPSADIVGMDASEGMLTEARRKPIGQRVRFLRGNAMDPASIDGAEGPYDGILMAYGIRNMPDPDLCLKRLLALLKPGGRICFHEYSVADSRRSRALWNGVCLGVIIPGGLFTAGSTRIYRYLRRSVLEFDGVTAFEERLRRAGFENVRTEAVDGWQRGIVHSFLGSRPA